MAWNDKALVNRDPDLTIETDASLLAGGELSAMVYAREAFGHNPKDYSTSTV